MKKIIECILKHHDKLSQASVLATNEKEWKDYFLQAAAIRGLLEVMENDENIISKKDRDKFHDLIKDHVSAMSRSLLWNREVMFDDNE